LPGKKELNIHSDSSGKKIIAIIFEIVPKDRKSLLKGKDQ